jgi:hypothetical protein
MTVFSVDTFTEILRWFVWIALGLLVMIVIGWVSGHWAQKRLRKLMDRHPHDVYDWADEETMYPRSHVSVPDRVPENWENEWS